jgi:hypothetical protein
MAMISGFVFLLVLSDRLHGDAFGLAFMIVLGAAQVLAYAIYKLVYKGPSGRRRDRLTTSASLQRSSSWRGDGVIERLCRETGWGFIGQEAGRHQVQSRGTRSPVAIDVCYGERQVNVLFQSWFPIRFSLEKPPAGLFARVLLRSHALNWSAWQMSIGGSCEACLYLSASVPRTALDACLFQAVCTEIAEELRQFHVELHDKFAYDLGGVVPTVLPAALAVPQPEPSFHLKRRSS